MLKGIVFHLSSKIAESPDVCKLLQALEQKGIACFSLSDSSSIEHSLSLSPEHCLVITASASGITSARTANLPCIGYAPPENTEDMSGAYALFEDFSSIDTGYLCRTHAHATGYPASILSTERLTVREFSEADFPALYAMCTEPSTASYMEEVLSDYITEFEKHTAYLRNVYPFFELALWGVCEKNTGRLIGRAGFSLPEDDTDAFSLGYLIDIPYRRCGYAKELIPALLTYAKEQGYTKISARIKKGNTGSVKALSQCGFPYSCEEDTAKGILTYHIRLTV